MSGPTIQALGRRLHALEPVPVVGQLLGLERGAAFRQAAEWPSTGPKGSRRIIVPALLDQLGIGYDVITDQEDEHEG